MFDAGVLIEPPGRPRPLRPGDGAARRAGAPGMAGKVVGGDGLVVLTWRPTPPTPAASTPGCARSTPPTASGSSPRSPDLDRRARRPRRRRTHDRRSPGRSRTAGPSAAAPTAPSGSTLGEIVFSTGMTGYQETLTDPSYHRQIVVMTAPHIGNTGVNDEDPESTQIWVAGYVVRDPARRASNWRSERDAGRRAGRPGHRRHQRDRHPRPDPPPARARRDARRHLLG